MNLVKTVSQASPGAAQGPEQPVEEISTPSAKMGDQKTSGPKVASQIASPQITLSVDKMNRRLIIGTMILFGLILAFMLRNFLVPLILAATFATLFYPMYRWLLRVLKGKRGLSSFFSCAVLVIGLLLPSYTVGRFVVSQTISFYGTTIISLRNLSGKLNASAMKKFGPQGKRFIENSSIGMERMLDEGIKAVNRMSSRAIDKTSRRVVQLIFNMLIMFFTLFYFFMDGDRLIARLRYLSPLRNEYEEMIINRFLLVSRAVIKGTVLVALVQSFLGALTLLIFGVKTWILWGFVMFVLALIPMMGCWIVLIPTSIIQIAIGNTVQGLGILIVTIVLISNIDNIIRPRLVGSAAKMHDLAIFFSILGGLATFGPLGFIVGPVIAAFFVTLLEMYGIEFKAQLFSESTSAMPSQADSSIRLADIAANGIHMLRRKKKQKNIKVTTPP